MSEIRDAGPQPDPTNRSEDAIYRATAAERDYTKGAIRVLETRLDAMDEANRVLSETVTRTPTEIQEAIGNLSTVMDERFSSLKEILVMLEEQRKEMKLDTEKAVQAALAAAKEAVQEQTKSSEKSILKSETATAESIRQQGITTTTAITGVLSNATDLKERVARMESRKEGATESKAGFSQSASLVIGILGVMLTVVIIGLTIVIALP